MLERSQGSFRIGWVLPVFHAAHCTQMKVSMGRWLWPPPQHKTNTTPSLTRRVKLWADFHSTREWTQIPRIPQHHPFQEVKIAGGLAPRHPWTLVVQHLPLSLSSSEVWSSGNQWVGVWYIFFKLYGKDCTLLLLPDIYDSCQAGELF